MGEISENICLFLIVAILCAIGFAIFYKTYLYVIDKFLFNEFTWLLQKTIYKSYLVFKSIIYAVLLAYFVLAIYSFFTSYWIYGLLIFGCLIYLFVKVWKSKKEGKFNLRKDFEFQKYNSKVSYYNDQTEEYRRKSFDSIIDKIKRTELSGISNEEYKNFLNENFLPKIDKLLAFEYYDSKLFNSISDNYTTTLFYRKYIKNVLETISRIDKLTKNLSLLNMDYQVIIDMLLDIRLIKFDDNEGLHYDISIIDMEIDKILNSDKENSNIEKSLLIINQSIDNLKLAFDKVGFEDKLSRQINALDELKEKINLIQPEKNYLIYVLSGNCTVNSLTEILTSQLESYDNIKMSAENISDVQEFVKRRFRNKANKQPTKKGEKYKDRSFFIKNREEFYKAASYSISKFSLEKKKFAEIIFEEFSDIGHSLKTIENRL
ncbi:hypothetical protein JSO61_006245 [Riemerella anatipestifer]|uniref:hypothetical protein n=1 Tax=Riemerella anatipestifer TaxID=34085 RepID=UPI002A885463|nr:hypothetical protein [Riemerella anatipestifer]